jgi:hypothetical protein
MKPIKRLPSPALVISMFALVAAMAGTAVALPDGAKVDTNDIAKRAVTSSKIDSKAVKGGKIASQAVKGGKIRPEAVSTAKLAAKAVTGAKIADDAVGQSQLADHKLIALTKVAATAGTDAATARAAAPPQELFKRGALTIYGKCYTDTTADETTAAVYAATTAAGSVMASNGTTLAGDPFLDPTTDEVDRDIDSGTASNNSAAGRRAVYEIASPDGAAVQGVIASFAKNGDLPGGDGVYGAGDACMFSGNVDG